MTGDDDRRSYASPPCFLHELSAEEGGVPGAVDAVQARDVARWRKAERARLLAERAALSVSERKAAAETVARHLDGLLGDICGKAISAWWPIQSELDLRFWLASLDARGASAALPLVTEKHAPLRFRIWTADAKMERGFWNIPVPAAGDWVTPDIALAPLVGFDAAGYRLGYGGGYFDRTLAANPGIHAIGIGLSAARLETIFPQAHDIRMRAIVTENGIA
ncbi:5-formyltetrahydrofolate cyclo-ligase [Defluviimonas sp. WL0024]|uniref:5-formyltetrahydrofolate cyclo-ligase n=2 Tax=Albidovulum TaxID=205889 RepID=A0ABT3J629_9RHOB|nr:MULTISPECIES: 5-formyltetrahydrofolate cyclo-ligase [Defluviimonas]MCU9849911.1 5-formyltetrahydrofolate cyclo-ligase [Defluviimonas sp. WL0024]MCW3783154.1 5-formyltetrahydrofolate cyclo-ligase [Defluviimonas salinarum]